MQAKEYMRENDLINQLVSGVSETTFQPRYRRVAVGQPVCGWGARLETYFWPKPQMGFRQTVDKLRPLIECGAELAEAYPHWTAAHEEEAVQFTSHVFRWGRVRPEWIDAAQVYRVFGAALCGEPADAPMSSGWTKVAALATSHLESEDRAHVIYDSRISQSMLRWIERILTRNGIAGIPDYLHLGRIPGRGGTLAAVNYGFNWPYADGQWDYQVAASAFVRKIRNELNRQDIPCPAPIGPKWTVRSVEMVLFMDGC